MHHNFLTDSSNNNTIYYLDLNYKVIIIYYITKGEKKGRWNWNKC